MLFKLAFTLSILVSYGFAQGQRCICVDESYNGGSGRDNGNGSTTTVVISIPVMGEAVNLIHYDTMYLPARFSNSFQQTTSPLIANFLMTSNELQRQGAPETVTKEIKRVQGTITERLDAGKNLSTADAYEKWILQLTIAARRGMSDLSKLANDPKNAAYRSDIESLILQLLTASNFYTYSSESTRCLYSGSTQTMA